MEKVMKKKLVALFTSLLLVIIACFSLVACGDNNDNSDEGNTEDYSLVGNWIYEGKVKDQDIYLVVSAGRNTGEYDAINYLIGNSNDYSPDNARNSRTSTFSFKKKEDGTYTDKIESPDKDHLTIGINTYTRTTQTLEKWQVEHDAYLKLLESSWVSDTNLQGYATAEKIETNTSSHTTNGHYILKLTYVSNITLFGKLSTESHMLESAGLTKNTYKWGKYTLTLEDDNNFTLTYENEFYSFTRTNQTIEEWKAVHDLS